MNPEYLRPEHPQRPGQMWEEARAIARSLETLERQPSPTDLITQWETTRPQRQGWRERRTRESDARIVRVVDFERALSHLTEEHQSILLLTYREHRDQR